MYYGSGTVVHTNEPTVVANVVRQWCHVHLPG